MQNEIDHQHQLHQLHHIVLQLLVQELHIRILKIIVIVRKSIPERGIDQPAHPLHRHLHRHHLQQYVHLGTVLKQK